jgi:hypothetical protein
MSKRRLTSLRDTPESCQSTQACLVNLHCISTVDVLLRVLTGGVTSPHEMSSRRLQTKDRDIAKGFNDSTSVLYIVRVGVAKKRVLAVAVAAVGATLSLGAPAAADPVDDPCQLAVSFLCRFMPMAPGLDHDIDLTQNSGTLNGQSLQQMPAGELPEDAPPAPVCGASGCS